MKTIIFDFMGIVADLNYVKLISDLPLTQKFSALRIFASLKKHPEIKYCFYEYQKGLISKTELEYKISEFCPNSSYIVPKLLENFNNYVQINYELLTLIVQLRYRGYQILLMSNTIPETEELIKESNLQDAFNGLLLSTELGVRKPQNKIYRYAIENYNLDPNKTIMIDDTKKNLIAAEQLGFQTIHCKNTNQVYKTVYNLLLDSNKKNLGSNI